MTGKLKLRPMVKSEQYYSPLMFDSAYCVEINDDSFIQVHGARCCGVIARRVGVCMAPVEHVSKR